MSDHDEFYLIARFDLDRLAAVASRLYTETRMDGDQMRDAAHVLTTVVRTAKEMPMPTEPPLPVGKPGERCRYGFTETQHAYSPLPGDEVLCACRHFIR